MYRFWVVVMFLSSCTSPPEEAWRTQEKLELSDRQAGRSWFDQIKNKIHFFGDEVTDTYLTEIGNRLIKKSNRIGESPLMAYAVKNEGRWMSFGLPGARVFLSTRLLREIEYESVLAAAIAFEIAKIENRVSMKKLEATDERIKKYEPTLETAILPASIDELSESAKTAVQLLYSSGFDSRGLVSYLKLLQNNIKVSPIDERSLKILIEISFEESSSLPPLIKPVVKGELFSQIRKRWSQKL